MHIQTASETSRQSDGGTAAVGAVTPSGLAWADRLFVTRGGEGWARITIQRRSGCLERDLGPTGRSDTVQYSNLGACCTPVLNQARFWSWCHSWGCCKPDTSCSLTKGLLECKFSLPAASSHIHNHANQKYMYMHDSWQLFMSTLDAKMEDLHCHFNSNTAHALL